MLHKQRMYFECEACDAVFRYLLLFHPWHCTFGASMAQVMFVKGASCGLTLWLKGSSIIKNVLNKVANCLDHDNTMGTLDTWILWFIFNCFKDVPFTMLVVLCVITLFLFRDVHMLCFISLFLIVLYTIT